MRRNYRKKNAKPIFRKISAKNLVAKKRRSNLVSLIKQINIKQSETKYKSATNTINLPLHNANYQIHCWGPSGTVNDIMPGQGTSDTNRVGDRIYVKGIMLRAMIQLVGDRRNTKVGVYWVPHNSEDGDPSSQLHHNITGSNMVDPLQKKRFPRAQKLGTYRVKPADVIEIAGASMADARNGTDIFIQKFVPINKKVFFQADASNKPSNMPEYGTFVFCFYHNYSALATDHVANGCDINTTLYYKDL